jgi:hypothetical protein
MFLNQGKYRILSRIQALVKSRLQESGFDFSESGDDQADCAQADEQVELE